VLRSRVINRFLFAIRVRPSVQHSAQSAVAELTALQPAHIARLERVAAGLTVR
jgi:hypothetical protein